MTKTIGIIGFGAFGKLIHSHLKSFFNIKIYDVNPSSEYNFKNIEEVASCDIVILAIPIQSFQDTLIKIQSHVQKNAIIIDVCSVKIFPVNMMLKYLPESVSILATHPLFGPQSIKNKQKQNKIVISPIRGDVNHIISFLEKTLNLHIVLSTPEKHDEEMAITQALFHWMAKSMLCFDNINIQMATQSFLNMNEAFNLVKDDTYAVYETIECYNPYAKQAREKFLSSLMENNDKLELMIC